MEVTVTNPIAFGQHGSRSMATLHRRAMADLSLPAHIRTRKGDHFAISTHCIWDENNNLHPSEFQAFRFADRRKISGSQNKSAYVSTSVDHLDFVHGKLVC
jgi:hypothetical protein